MCDWCPLSVTKKNGKTYWSINPNKEQKKKKKDGKKTIKKIGTTKWRQNKLFGCSLFFLLDFCPFHHLHDYRFKNKKKSFSFLLLLQHCPYNDHLYHIVLFNHDNRFKHTHAIWYTEQMKWALHHRHHHHHHQW